MNDKRIIKCIDRQNDQIKYREDLSNTYVLMFSSLGTLEDFLYFNVTGEYFITNVVNEFGRPEFFYINLKRKNDEAEEQGKKHLVVITNETPILKYIRPNNVLMFNRWGKVKSLAELRPKLREGHNLEKLFWDGKFDEFWKEGQWIEVKNYLK